MDKIFDPIKFGKRVKECREHLGLTQAALASKTGIHQTTIGRIERADLSPTIENVFQIANAVGVSIDFLCDYQKSILENEWFSMNSTNLPSEAADLILETASFMVKYFNNKY